MSVRPGWIHLGARHWRCPRTGFEVKHSGHPDGEGRSYLVTHREGRTLPSPYGHAYPTAAAAMAAINLFAPTQDNDR